MSSLKSKPDILRLRGAAMVTLGLLSILTATGCRPKEAVTTPVAPAPGAPGTGVPAAPVKLTPEQEALKQRAIQQGPAIEAAMKRGQGQ